MDSGNSGSLQSSSGGDDDYDSRGGGVDSSPLSALLRPAPSPSAAGAFSLHGSLYGLQDFTSGPPQHQQQQQAPWSAQFMPGPASSSQRAAPADAGMGSGTSAHHQASDPSAAAAPAPAPPRGSRKRARASRRAPTTVLTTDTSNFRAMVQEFTGIPNPPFGAGGAVGPGAPFGSRFDHIFSSSSALRSAADPSSSLPPYLLRPFAQKLQTAAAPSPFSPFTSPSSSTPASANVGGPNANVNATAAATTASASANQRAGDDFQLPSSALLRMQQDQSSSYLSFQNLLGSTQPMSQHMFGGLSHGAPRLHEQSPSQLLSSVGGIGLTHGGMMVSEGMHMHQQQRNDVHQGGGDELSGVVRAGASGSGGGGSCKLNYTSSHAGASSSSAAASTDAPPDSASRPGRSEGLDPWLCTSE